MLSIQFNSIIYFIVIFLAFSSCETKTSERSISHQEEYRLKIANNTEDEMKSEFFKLSFKDQKMLWIDKFSQIQSKNISKQHNELLQNLKNELEKASQVNDLYNESIKFTTLELIRITPKSDFIDMFMTLDNYKGSFDKSNFELCSWCITELENDFSKKINTTNNNYRKIGENNNASKLSSVEANCNCSWTCLEDATSNCTISGGCGFLFLFDCKKYS